MKFEIKGDKQKIKEFLDEFISLAKKEYEAQKEKWEGKSIMGQRIMLPEFELGYFEEDEKIIFWNTLPSPKGFQSLIFKPLAEKMKKNLEGYFQAKGIKAEVKILRD